LPLIGYLAFQGFLGFNKQVLWLSITQYLNQKLMLVCRSMRLVVVNLKIKPDRNIELVNKKKFWIFEWDLTNYDLFEVAIFTRDDRIILAIHLKNVTKILIYVTGG